MDAASPICKSYGPSKLGSWKAGALPLAKGAALRRETLVRKEPKHQKVQATNGSPPQHAGRQPSNVASITTNPQPPTFSTTHAVAATPLGLKGRPNVAKVGALRRAGLVPVRDKTPECCKHGPISKGRSNARALPPSLIFQPYPSPTSNLPTSPPIPQPLPKPGRLAPSR